MPVDAIVCAHDEEERIAAVLEPLSRSAALGNLIVVADACTDATAGVAAEYATHVIQTTGRDKGTAMATGLGAVTSELVAFLDADLRGLTVHQVDRLLTTPPLNGQLVGLRDGYPHICAAFPSLSGERRLPTWLAREVPLLGSGWKAEMLINVAVARAGLPWHHVVLQGVDNLSKFKARDHPLAWLGEQLQLTDATITYLPELVRYMAHPQGSGSFSGSGGGSI